MARSIASDSALEQRVIERGKGLLGAVRRALEQARPVDRWLERLLNQAMEDPRFRAQALRFIDCLPALEDDREITRHLYEYFGEGEVPLSGLVLFGVRHVRAGVASALVGRAVRKAAHGLARRFLGGATAEEALRGAEALRRQRIGHSLDLVGEAVVSEREAERYLERYLELLRVLPARVGAWEGDPLLDRGHGRSLPRLNLSLKLSSLDSQITPIDPEGSAERIAARLRPILHAARRAGAFICIDMEQYAFKELTLVCFKRLLTEPELCDWPDVGIALQAYLRETEADLRNLIDWTTRRGAPVTVRLVRGAYWDYETVIAEQHGWAMPVWTRKWQTDACYERCLRLLLAHHPRIEAAVATHNVRSMAYAMAMADECGLERDGLEFQMLHGMAGALEHVLPQDGYRLRVYLPFGELLPGMAYLVRRLLENTSSQSFQRMNLAGQLVPAQLLASPHGADAVEPSVTAHPGPAEAEGLPTFVHEPVHRFSDSAERAAFLASLREVRAGLGASYPLLIDGMAVDSGSYIASINPARPSEIIGRVAAAEPRHAEQAFRGALQSLPGWSGRSAEGRAQCLQRAAMELRRRRDEFAALEILEAGKTWAEADVNVTEAIDYLEFYAREALRLAVPRVRHCPGEENVYTYAPRGVGLVVPPWNFPLAILTGMLSAAIVTGNTVILKPSSQTPVIAARFAALLQGVGVAPGVVQFLPGRGASLGEYLVTHPGLAFIAFTGSKEVGTRIIRLAAELVPGQIHVKHVVAEMGGKNAIIVDADADLDDAVVGVMQSAFGYQGQKCSACSRVIVVGRCYERFVERLIEATRGLRIGVPEDPGVALGPVIESQARERILGLVSEAVRGGARLALQCPVPDLGEGYFLGPAIFTDVVPDSPLAQEEIFGPVLAVLRAADFETAIAIANRSSYALTGGLYSRSPVHIEYAQRTLEVGNLYVNRKITGALVDRQPFGGYKLSGLGSKAGGPDYLLQFVVPRTLTENTLRRGFAPSPPGSQ